IFQKLTSSRERGQRFPPAGRRPFLLTPGGAESQNEISSLTTANGPSPSAPEGTEPGNLLKRSHGMAENMGVPSRRDFMKSAVATTVAAGGLAVLGSNPLRAEEKKSFKIGLIGCGGRGTGALSDCLKAGEALGVEMKVVALCDAFGDRASRPAAQH